MYVFIAFNSYSPPVSYWTDLREVSNSKPGTWKWGDGTALNYSSTDPWDNNQPDSASQDRASLDNPNLLLWDMSRSYGANFICEK